ncbi:MAG: amidase [Leucobacter sp.]
MSEEIDPSGAWALREALRLGEASSRDLVGRALDLAEAHCGPVGEHYGHAGEPRGLGSFVSLNRELALAEADAADARIAATPRPERHGLPPLLGLPTAHKDLVDQRGHVTTHGSWAVPHLVAEHDEPITAAVRAAGAVSIGKTQVPEFGIAGYSENELAPPARNPHDPALTAGGSSGGTAAAIASGVIPAAIASDAGGSIRIPAAACGLIGLKPGRGVVPADALRGPLDEAGAPRMGVSGPIARSARDAALLYDALLVGAGSPALRAVQRAEDLRGLRIGVSLASPFEGWVDIRFDPEARAALDAGVEALASLGHAVEETRFAYDPRYPEAFTTVWTAALARVPFEPAAEQRLGALARMFLERARATPAEALAEAVEALHAFAAGAVQQWGSYDAVLTPALAFPPPRVGAFRELGPEGDYRLQCQWAPQTSMVNVTGMPAVAVPVRRTPATAGHPDGLPMGVQLIGRAGDEIRLLQLAEQLTAYASTSR